MIFGHCFATQLQNQIKNRSIPLHDTAWQCTTSELWDHGEVAQWVEAVVAVLLPNPCSKVRQTFTKQQHSYSSSAHCHSVSAIGDINSEH